MEPLRWFLKVGWLLSVVSCSSGVRQGGSGGSGGGSAGGGPIDTGGSPPPGTCTNQQFAPQKLGAPDILLVQDISSSMSEQTPSKYDRVVSALSNVVSNLDAQMSPVQWGLLMFPTDSSCGVDQLAVPVGMG